MDDLHLFPWVRGYKRCIYSSKFNLKHQNKKPKNNRNSLKDTPQTNYVTFQVTLSLGQSNVLYATMLFPGKET